MARTVKDAALILSAIASQDPNDNYTLANPSKHIPDYSKYCKKNGLKGKRLGIPRNVLEINNSTATAPYYAAFNEAIKALEAAGATIIDNTNFTSYNAYIQHGTDTVLNADFITNLATYLTSLKTNPQNLHNLSQVQAYTHKYPAETWPLRNTAIWDQALQAGINNTDPAFWPAYQKNLFYGGKGGVSGAVERYELDAVVLPTNLGYPVPALVGEPVITVPMGVWPAGTPVQLSPPWNLTDVAGGVPMGLAFMGLKWSEGSLIEMAYAYEQATLVREGLGHWIVPRAQL